MSRPLTLRQIAERADSLDEFGRHFRDWLHELRHFSSRDKVVAAVTDEPGRLVKIRPGRRGRRLAGGLRRIYRSPYSSTCAALGFKAVAGFDRALVCHRRAQRFAPRHRPARFPGLI